MNISELTQERLKISLKAINQDPTISHTLKNAFVAFNQCLNDHQTTIDILESQITDKASSTEMHYAISQKLSVAQFLKYFQKIQKIVEGMQSHMGKQQQKLQTSMNEKVMKIASHLEVLIDQNKKSFQQSMMKKINGNNQQLEKVKKEIHDFRQQIELIKVNKDSNKENKQQLNIPISDKKCKQLLQEVRVIQEYCEEHKYCIDQLMERSNKLNVEKYVNFNDLRSIINNLETTLTQSITSYIFNTTSPKQSKAFWQSSPTHNQLAIFQTSQENQTSKQNINFQEDRILVKETGIYQIICGFFPQAQSEIRLWLNGDSILAHKCVDAPKPGICRTLMLYINLVAGSQLVLNCMSQRTVEGFICFSRF